MPNKKQTKKTKKQRSCCNDLDRVVAANVDVN